MARVPEDEWDDLSAALANAWRPNVFETADLGGGISVYWFRVENRAGRKQMGLPEGFRTDPDGESPD